METDTERILKIIEAKHKASNGSCGTYVIDISRQIGLTIPETEQILLEMFNTNQIDVREGIHGAMIMKLESVKIHK